MHIKLRDRLEQLKKTPRSQLPKLVDKRPVYYIDGCGRALCPECANWICSEFDKEEHNQRDLPIEFHVLWFPEEICDRCECKIKSVYKEEA